MCGAHLQGQPLNWQLIERGAQLSAKTTTAPHYRLYALPDGQRPALSRVATQGANIAVEIWSMPHEAMGSFVENVTAPLGIGKVELQDGRWVSGFICQQYGLAGAEDITRYGSWREWLASSPTL